MHCYANTRWLLHEDHIFLGVLARKTICLLWKVLLELQTHFSEPRHLGGVLSVLLGGLGGSGFVWWKEYGLWIMGSFWVCFGAAVLLGEVLIFSFGWLLGFSSLFSGVILMLGFWVVGGVCGLGCVVCLGCPVDVL